MVNNVFFRSSTAGREELKKAANQSKLNKIDV